MDADVLIVGGGIAGLAVARRLSAAGRAVLVLEGRDRLGGRAYSPALADGARFDLGPSWFWPGQKRVADLASALEIAVFRQPSDGNTVFQDAGGAVRRDLAVSLNPDGLRFKGGVGRLAEALAAALPTDRLRCGAEVAALVRDGEGWVAETTDGARFSAKAVALAVPPRVIAEQIRIPSAPAELMEALRGVETWMAGHAKAVAVYAQPFWRADGLSGDAVSHRGPLAQIHDASPMTGAPGALFGFVGPEADARARVGTAALQGAILSQLAELFGDAAAEPIAFRLEDWSTQEFTATAADRRASGRHPHFARRALLESVAEAGLALVSTETAPEDAGLLEGALAAAEWGADRVERRLARP